MKISDSVRALLKICGVKQGDLIKPLDMTSKQSLNNKFSLDRWSGKDLISVANITGCRVGFLLPNGDWLLFDNDEYKPKDEAGE